MNIITVTLSPAFDVHCYSENFMPYHENLARITATEAGGKGVNISRALTVNGIKNTALAVLGSDNAESFRRSLLSDGIELCEISVSGRIRENITLHTENAPETRISFSGFSSDDSLIDKVLLALDGRVDENTVLTFTGRLPDGVSVKAAKRMLSYLSRKGAKIVLDSRSFDKQDIIDVSPWLIKPNEEEIGAYADIEVNSFEAAARAAVTLRKSGIENVMISLGEKGAMLCCEDGCFVARAPRIEALSTVGAGDSSIVGFLAAIKDGRSYADALRLAVCYGTAACLTEGTRPPKPKDVKKLIPLVAVERI